MKKTLPPAAVGPAPDAALVAMPRPAETLDRAGRANFFHRLSREAGAVAIRAALAAGVELLEARRELAGGFVKWVQAKCAFGVATAYRYIQLAEATLPEAAVPALLEGSDEDRTRAVEEAASAADSRTLTDLYADLGIVRRTPSRMGGRRNEAAEANGHRVGRPPKDAKAEAEAVAAEIEAAANAPALLWASARGALDTLVKLDSEKDFLRRIGDDELATAAGLLADLSRKAAEILAPRLAAREGGAR